MKQNNGFFTFLDWFSAKNLWIIEIGIGLIILIFAALIATRFIRDIRSKWKVQKDRLKIKVDFIFLGPLKVLFIIVATTYVADVAARQFALAQISHFLNPLRNAAIVVCVTWMVLRWKKELQANFSKRTSKKKKHLDQVSVDFIGKLFSIAILFISVLIILEIFGIDVMPLVAFGGIGAAAVGFAAKDVIANLFGGLMIYILRPMVKGEFVNIPEKGLMGIVEEIGWYNTVIRDLGKTPLYVPNALFSTALVKNISRMTHRQFEETVSISYNDINKVQELAKEIENYLRSHEKIDQKQMLFVRLKNFADYSVEITMRSYILETKYDEFLATRQEILLHIKDLIYSFGATIPFPTTTIDGFRDIAQDLLHKH